MKENSRKCSLRGNGTRLGRDSVTGAGGTGREAGVVTQKLISRKMTMSRAQGGQ